MATCDLPKEELTPEEREAYRRVLDKLFVPQPAPTGDGAPILPLVVADLTARAEHGRRKYGTALRANNSRDSLRDAKEEVYDLAMYLRQFEEDLPRMLAEVRAQALEDAALAAEADLGEVPPGPYAPAGLAAERERWDAGASASTAHRIATRIRELAAEPPKGGR
jgi:hypothetical protein